MKLASFLIVWASILAAGVCLGQLSAADRAATHELQGRFQEAAQILNSALGNTALAPAERKQLEFELDRLERIKKDYPYTKEVLFKELKKSVKGLTAVEFGEGVSSWY